MANIFILNLNASCIILNNFLFKLIIIKLLLYTDRYDSSKFRVLCKNGSLAQYPGLDVEESCALSVTIDSEVNNFCRKYLMSRLI